MRRHAFLALLARLQAQRGQTFLYGCCALLLFIAFTPLMIDGDVPAFLQTANNLLRGKPANPDLVAASPLWLLLNIYLLPALPPYLVLFIVSLGCMVGALHFLLASTHAPHREKAVLMIFPLFFSKILLIGAFSGLESPLLCLLISWFTCELLTTQRPYRLVLAASLMLAASASATLLLLPALAYALAQQRAALQPGKLMACLVPAVLALAFCFSYYGVFFPDIPAFALPEGLFLQFRSWLLHEPYSTLAVALGIGAGLCPVIQARSFSATAQGDRLLFTLAIGMLLYLLLFTISAERPHRSDILPLFWVAVFICYHGRLRHLPANAVHAALLLISIHVGLSSAVLFYRVDEVPDNLSPKPKPRKPAPTAIYIHKPAFWKTPPFP